MPGLSAHAGHGVVSPAMGHAPEPGTQPAMPNTARTVRNALGLLKRRGYSQHESLTLMCNVLVRCKILLGSAGIHEHYWVDDLLTNVTNRLRAPTSSATGTEARSGDNPTATTDGGG